jgi:hypothetical protein
MSNLFKKLKTNIIKNITPFELALRTHTNAFVETFLNSNGDYEFSSDSSSEENHSRSDYTESFDTHSGSDADDEHEVNIDINLKENLDVLVPIQQVCLKENLDILVPIQQVCLKENLDVLVPIQQTFDKDLCNLETCRSFPVNSSNNDNIEKINPSISTINNCDLDILPTEVENNTNISTNIPVDIFNDHLLINNLSILSHIEKYQKLSVIYDNTNNKLNFQIQIDESYFPQLSRWYYNQNRTNTIATIDNLIDYSLQQYAYYTDTNNEKYIKKYNSLLNNAQKGLLNLKITYESDIENSFKISKIIEKITN